MSAISEIMNVKVDCRFYVNALHRVFLKKHQYASRFKTKFFFENRGHTFVRNAMILTCAKIHRKTLMFRAQFVEVLFGMGLKIT